MRRYAPFLGASRRHCAPACDWSVGAAPAGLCAFLPIQLRRSAGIIRQPCLSSRQCQPQAFARDKTGRYCRRTVGARTGRRPGGPRARPRSERSRARRHRTQALVRLSGGGGRRETDQLRDGRLWLRDLYVRTDARRTGAGRALMVEIARLAIGQGCEAVYWDLWRLPRGQSFLRESWSRRNRRCCHLACWQPPARGGRGRMTFSA